MANTIQKDFSPNSKDVRYLNRDFSQFRESLINFSKTYFPHTYKDFSPASPGMMFIEQVAYVGDVLSYYTDYAFKEGQMFSVTERKNIVSLASQMGYKIKPARAAIGEITLMQLCPAADDGMGNYFPDPDYMLIIKENSQFSTNENAYFILNSVVDFSINTAASPRKEEIYSRNPDGTPLFFLLTKKGSVSAGQIYTKEVVVGSPSPYFTVKLGEKNVLSILSIVDSDDNNWYETEYLAQELVPISVPNIDQYEGSLSQYRDSVPYILKYLKTSRRFVVNVDEENYTYIQFGAGISGTSDEIVTFDSNLLGVGLVNSSRVNIPLDPSNFLSNENYGMAPQNTVLTITYLIGGGLNSNCQSDEIKNVASVLFDNPSEGLLPEQVELLNTVKNSLQVTNMEPVVGGKDAETNEEIKLNAMAHFASQNRAVTQNDYLVRIYSLPPQFGSIAKAQIVSDSNLNIGINKILDGVIDSNNNGSVIDNRVNNYFRKVSYDITNPFAINVYILSYDSQKRLIKPNKALIKNLITYLKQYRIITDGINIIDGYIINIGVEFSITVYKGYNKKDVLLSCIKTVQNFFNIDKWNFSQPINLSQLQLEIAKVNGVQSVVNVKITNKTSLDGDYSPVEYDIKAATKNGIIYPSVDPSVFEVKFPSSDIIGACL
ncbi:MAG TPA: hypothetical protein PKX15_02985 [Bacteroidales bacterium]|nr:hypothetical protein [Bacteroidales bacterium]